MSLREGTFAEVRERLKNAEAELKAAADLLKDSGYWSGTTEFTDIRNLERKTKAMADYF